MESPKNRDELRVAIQKRVDEIVALAQNYGDENAVVSVSTDSVYISDSYDWSSSWESSDASC